MKEEYALRAQHTDGRTDGTDYNVSILFTWLFPAVLGKGPCPKSGKMIDLTSIWEKLTT